GRRSRGFDAAEYLQRRTADRIRESARLPAAGFGRSRQDRQSLFRNLRTRTRGAEVQRNNGAGGSSDIEGKAAMGSGERAGKRASFNGAAERNGRGLIRRVFFNRLGAANLLR